MYQNIITDVYHLDAAQPTDFDEAFERYTREWRESPVYIYITPKDAENTIPVVIVRGLIPTYSQMENFIATPKVPLNINMWNPVACTFESAASAMVAEQLADYDVFLGRIG